VPKGFFSKIIFCDFIAIFVFLSNFRVVGVDLEDNISAKKTKIKNRLWHITDNICKILCFKFQTNWINCVEKMRDIS